MRASTILLLVVLAALPSSAWAREFTPVPDTLVFTPDKLDKMEIPAGTVPLGAWVGYHLPEAADYAKAKDGGLLMFSIEGQGVREAV